jgi:TPP-dependent pyruvate/acetoin dehydrogenase alpha subunit
MAHSKGDDDRPKDELARYWAQDPIARFTEQFPKEAAKLKQEAEAKIDHAVANWQRLLHMPRMARTRSLIFPRRSGKRQRSTARSE